MTMFKPWRALLVGGMAAVSGLAFADQALAQTPPPSPARLQMAMEFSQDMFQSVDFGPAVVKGMGDMGAAFAQVKGRPDWPDLFKQSAIEELQADRPKISRYVGKLFAAYFTEEELKVALKMMNGPAGPELSQMIAAAARSEPPQPLSARAQQAIASLAREPGAQSFFVKFGNIESVMKPLQDAIVPMIVPGMFKRFGEKTQAEEDRLEAANGG